MNEKDRVADFKALVESHKTNFSHLEEPGVTETVAV